MIAFSIFGYECLAERWEPEARLLDRSRWLTAARRIGGQGGGWEAFWGPFHVMVCRSVRPAAPDLGA